MEEKQPDSLFCVSCDRKIVYLEFSKNHSDLCKNRLYTMPFCNSCLKKISDKIFEEHTDFYCATIQMCNSFWIPFNLQACKKLQEFEKSEELSKKYNRVIQYCTFLKEVGVAKEEWNNLTGNNYIAVQLFKQMDCQGKDIEGLINTLEDKWTKGLTIEDYLFLEEKFYAYSNGEKMSPAMLNTLKYLCQAELDVKRFKESGVEQKEIDAAEKRVMGYYKTLKLDDFKFDEAKSDIEKTIENWAYYQEEKEPLDWVDEKLEDINGFRKDNDDIMRAIGNKVVGTKDYPELDITDVKKVNQK